MRSLARSLVKYEKIITTEAKAKSLRPFIESLVTKAAGDNVTTRRLISSRLGGEADLTKKLVDEMELSADVLDLRTLVPLDWNRIFESVKKCSRVLVLHEDTLFGGIGGEIAAGINEHCFEYLDAPVKRLASIDTPVPFDKGLENNFLPQERLKRVVEDLLKY
jgi:pyruvate/2-oxoglutarate/acetoin dehydrogenase E1 component